MKKSLLLIPLAAVALVAVGFWKYERDNAYTPIYGKPAPPNIQMMLSPPGSPGHLVVYDYYYADFGPPQHHYSNKRQVGSITVAYDPRGPGHKNFVVAGND